MRHAGLAALFLLASAAPTRADPLTIHALAAAHGLAGMHSLDKLPAPPTLRLRAGEHFGFSRLVMDLPLGVTPQVTVGPDSVLLTLPGTRLELPAVRPRHVRAIAAEGDGIAITLAPGARLRRADLMGRLVFDLLDPLPRAAPAALPVPLLPTLAIPAVPPPAIPQFPVAAPASAPLLPVAEAALPAPAAQAPPFAPIAEAAVTGPLRVAAQPDGEAGAVLLPFAPGTAAAALRRGDEALLVFDEPRPVDLATLQGITALAGARVQLLPAATLLRLPLEAARSLRLRQVPGGWWVTLAPLLSPTAPIEAVAAAGMLRLPAASPGRVVSIPDPVTGGLLLVGTLHGAVGDQPEPAVATPRLTPEFDLLATWQGVAIEPLSDVVELRPDGAGFVVRSGQPGRVLAMAAGELATAPAAAAVFSRRFDLPALATAALLNRLRAAAAAAAASPPLQRATLRLDAAQAMLALGMGAEAQALVRLAIIDDARLATDPQAHAIGAVAAILAGHRDAARDIDDPSLTAPDQGGADEVTLWRALRPTQEIDRDTDAGSRLAPELARSLALRLPLLLSYPEALRQHLLPRAIETLALGGEAAAARAVCVARPDDRSLDLARAELAAVAGQNADALARLDTLARGDDRDVRDRAAIRAVELRLQTHALDPEHAAEALDRLTYAWRGDGRELTVRLRVAELRAQAGQFRASLGLLREAAAPGLAQFWPERVALIRTREEATLTQAMASDARTALAPLDLIALAEENADLLPSGEAGQALAQRLADRLIALDLPDRAAPALRKLVDAAPGGAIRAGLGARLAELQMELNQPEQALVALSASTAPLLPAPLTERRIELFARATAMRGNVPAALGALANVDSPAADELRAHLLEGASRWPEAEAALAQWVARAVPQDGALDADEAALLLRLAAAAAQAGDTAALERLRVEDLPRMPPGHAADTLTLLTQRPIRDVSDLPRAAREAALSHALLQ